MISEQLIFSCLTDVAGQQKYLFSTAVNGSTISLRLFE